MNGKVVQEHISTVEFQVIYESYTDMQVRMECCYMTVFQGNIPALGGSIVLHFKTNSLAATARGESQQNTNTRRWQKYLITQITRIFSHIYIKIPYNGTCALRNKSIIHTWDIYGSNLDRSQQTQMSRICLGVWNLLSCCNFYTPYLK